MEQDTLKKNILEITDNEKPETINILIELIENETGLSKDQITNAILELKTEGKLLFIEEKPRIDTIGDYLFTKYSIWFWVSILISIATINAIYTIGKTSGLIYIRYILGIIFLLFLPGYTLLKALYAEKELNTLETVVLSIAVNLSILPLIGMILHYTPWGLALTPVLISLTLIVISSAVFGLIRGFMAYKNKPL